MTHEATGDDHPAHDQEDPVTQTPGESAGQDPFGGFDLGAVLQQAQAMQSQIVQAQQELAEASVEGSAGGPAGVVVTLDGTGELTAVRISPGAADPDDEESWTDLGDLVVAAYRDAKSQVDELAAQTLGPLAGGLGGGGGGGLDLGGMFGGGAGGELGSGDEPRRSGF